MTAANDDTFDDFPPLPEVKPNTLEDVVKSLNSSYGDFSSFSKPYKRVNTLSSDHIFYNPKQGEFFSKVAISSEHQAPGGDTYDNTVYYILSRSDARLLVDAAPQGFKREAKVIADALQQAYDLEVKRQMDALKVLIEYMSKGAPAPVPAPERARFKPPKGPRPA